MGEVFAGRYELVDPVAEGGMGSVWRVFDRKDETYKAAKILRQSDAASLLRFVREQSLRIDHQHILTPLSWAGEDDRVLFTMPLLRGGSVATLIGDYGPLPLHWTVTLLDQTLQALEAVHEAGVIHRDVKPSNLLLEVTGRGRPHLRLTDFGLAVPIDEPRLTRTSVVLGSPGYIAPEQLQGADPDPRQDIFGAGNVGIEMLLGRRPPYPDVDLGAATVPPPEADGRRLLSLLREAIDEDPARRPSSATELRRRLVAAGLTSFQPVPDDIEVFDVLSHDRGPTATAAAEPATRPPERIGAVWVPVLVTLVGLACLAGALWVLLSL